MRKEELSRTAYKIDKLKNVAIGVSTGPSGVSKEKGHVGEYIRQYGEIIAPERDIILYNPDEETQTRLFADRFTELIDSGAFDPSQALQIPWKYPRENQEIKMDRMVGTIVAFTDDHGNKIAREFFPVDRMLTFLHNIRSQSLETGQRQTLLDQLNTALPLADNNPIGAALLAHGSYRAVGRSWDSRVDERLKFPITSDTEDLTMVSLAQSTAHFDADDRKGDPLGDTYHYWAQFAAAMVFNLNNSARPLESNVYRTAFQHGPTLMHFVRETLLHKTLAAGNHKEVNMQAVRIGTEMGNLIAENIKQ